MVSREALEKVIKEDLAGIWDVLTPEEKRLIIDNFTVHNFKRNQIIYAEKETPEYLWCLIKGKVKKEVKKGIRGLENVLNNTARTSDGNLRFVSNVEDDPESFIG